jgi:hypothetical protein
VIYWWHEYQVKEKDMTLPDIQYVRVIVGYGQDEIVYTLREPSIDKLSIMQPLYGPMSILLSARGEGGILDTRTE